MFVSNKIEDSDLLEKWELLLGKKKAESLKKSKGYYFYEVVFKQIKEEDFRVLYSAHPQSAPNSPVNRLVGALILIEQRNWTHSEFSHQIKYNAEIRVALGLKDMEEEAFHMRTLYNFKNRLNAYA